MNAYTVHKKENVLNVSLLKSNVRDTDLKTHLSPVMLVRNLSCLYYSINNLTCTWNIADDVQDLSLYYRYITLHYSYFFGKNILTTATFKKVHIIFCKGRVGKAFLKGLTIYSSKLGLNIRSQYLTIPLS